ncbi:hypothetical protein OPQ81_001128 [Rhizoctonia solani]|nr:hypothetical protein OPQ81_001128 [Rhizoctonia solani]
MFEEYLNTFTLSVYWRLLALNLLCLNFLLLCSRRVVRVNGLARGGTRKYSQNVIIACRVLFFGLSPTTKSTILFGHFHD